MEKEFLDSLYDTGKDLQGMMREEDSMILLATSDDCDSWVCSMQGNGGQLATLLHNAAETNKTFKKVLLTVAVRLVNEQNK